MSSAPTIGYVKLHRKLLDWEWIGDPNVLAVFIQVLLRVNREPKRWQGIDIPAGSFLTSRDTLAGSCGLSVKQVRRALDVLKGAGTIGTDRAGTGQLVSLRNWEEYQEGPSKQGRQRASDRADAGPDEGRSRATTREGKEVRESREGENVADRLEAFRSRVREVHEKDKILSGAEVHRFFAYWTERGEKAKKHRWEFEKTFDIGLRMHNWASRVRPTNTPANGRPGTKPSATEHLKQQIANGRFGEEARAAVSRPTDAPENPLAAAADAPHPALGARGPVPS